MVVGISDREYKLIKLGIYLCLHAGLRIGELCTLKWEKIDLNNDSLYVVATVQRIKNPDTDSTQKTVLMITDPQTSSLYRTIPLPPQLILLLKEFAPTITVIYFSEVKS